YKKDGKERNVNIEANFAGFGAELEVDLEKSDKITVSSSKNDHPRPKLIRQNCIDHSK
ncbi:TPA: hypothetical protein RUZ10_003630, partial [Vibrio cholerae]|nr:hypothetical protein [Vibrio cholerae]